MPFVPAHLRQVERPNLGCSEAAIGRAPLLPTLAGAASPRGSAVPLPHGGVGSFLSAPSGPGIRKARVADEHITPCRAEADGAGSFSHRSHA